jgi:hypothetical protein
MAVMVTSSSVGVLVCDLDEAALGEDVETKVAALLGPFVVLFGQDDRRAVSARSDRGRCRRRRCGGGFD